MDAIWCSDGISLSDLTLLNPQSASLDAWSRKKQQPIQLSIRLSLAAPFATAAASDALDASTLHYGHLAKALSSLPASEQWESLDSLAHRLANAIPRETAQSTTIKLTLPKGSLLSESVEYVLDLTSGREPVGTLVLNRLNLPVLVGLNAHERTRKQPLLISVELRDIPSDMSDIATQLDLFVEDAIKNTAYETLESMILDLVAALETGFLRDQAPKTTIRIRVEKPMAVGWAAAPSLEVVRGPRDRHAQDATKRAAPSGALKVYRPYMTTSA